MTTFGVAPTFLMPDHLHRVHQFVSASELDLHHTDDEARSGSSMEDTNEAGLATVVIVSTSDANVTANLTPHPA